MNRRLAGILFVLVALSVVLAPQASAAGTKQAKAAAKATCKAERAALGPKLFRSTYGPQPVAACRRRTLDEAQEAVANAARQCVAERAEDLAAFREKYGTNGIKRNAFGRCVSQKAKKELRAEIAATLNAAKECKAERTDDPAAFRETYGTNANKSNAFGKCVSGKKKAGQDEPEEEPGEEDPGEGDTGGGGEV